MRTARVLAATLAALAGGGSRLAAQKISLSLRPRAGDTISMRIDQRSEISAGKRDSLKPPAPIAAAAASMVMTTTTWSRAIVESVAAASTTILAITDSVVSSGTDQHGRASAAAAQRQYQGQSVRLTIAPDGSIGMPTDGGPASKGMSRAASLIPATFPSHPVAVGERWTREAPLPAGTSQLGTGIVGKVRATFRLDSVTHAGTLAWVSMRGTLLPDEHAKPGNGMPMVEDGSVEGYMIIDHARGWLTDSRFSILAHSVLRPAFGVIAQPMYFEIRLTQTLTTLH